MLIVWVLNAQPAVSLPQSTVHVQRCLATNKRLLFVSENLTVWTPSPFRCCNNTDTGALREDRKNAHLNLSSLLYSHSLSLPPQQVIMECEQKFGCYPNVHQNHLSTLCLHLISRWELTESQHVCVLCVCVCVPLFTWTRGRDEFIVDNN